METGFANNYSEERGLMKDDFRNLQIGKHYKSEVITMVTLYNDACCKTFIKTLLPKRQTMAVKYKKNYNYRFFENFQKWGGEKNREGILI